MRVTAAHRAIVALLLDGRQPAEVVEFLIEYEIDQVDEASVEQVRSKISLPRCSWYPRDESHAASQRYLRRHGLGPWFAEEKELALARRLLRHPRAREIADSLIILDAPPGWVRGVTKRHGVLLTDRAIELYRAFFFDVGQLDDHRLERLLDRRTQAGWQSRADRRFAALASRGSPVGLFNMAVSLGQMPNRLDIARVVRAARDAAGARTLEAVLANRPRRAERFAVALRSTNVVLEAIGDATGELLDGLTSATLATTDERVPLLHELEGDHTVMIETTEDLNEQAGTAETAGAATTPLP